MVRPNQEVCVNYAPVHLIQSDIPRHSPPLLHLYTKMIRKRSQLYREWMGDGRRHPNPHKPCKPICAKNHFCGHKAAPVCENKFFPPLKAAKLRKMEEKGEFAVPSKNGVDPHFPGMSPRKRKMPSPFIPSSSAQFTQNGFPDEQFFFYDRFLCSFLSSFFLLSQCAILYIQIYS